MFFHGISGRPLSIAGGLLALLALQSFVSPEAAARRVRNPSGGGTSTSTSTATSTSTSTNLFADNFSAYTAGTCFNDGQFFGQWESTFGGYGCNSILTLTDGGKVFSEQPQQSVSSGETHASLAIGPGFTGDITFRVSVNTVKQLRTGSPPNAWEVGWVLWNYTDNTHFYYFIAKPNGWELGKEDPNYPGAQRFLASGSSPAFPVGSWHDIVIRQSRNTITVSVDGMPITSFTDTERPYNSGKIGLYNEDANVYFRNISVTAP